MNHIRLIKFIRRATARNIHPVEIYVRAKRRFAASHCPSKIRQILKSMGMLL